MSQMMQNAATVAQELNARDDVARAVNWENSEADVSVLVEDGTDIGPIRGSHMVVNINDFDAASYTLIELDVR